MMRARRDEAVWSETHRVFDLAQRIAQLGVWTYDPARDRVERSPELCRILGVPDGRTGRLADVLATIPEADRAAVAAAFDEAVANGGSFAVRHRVRRASDGAERVVDRRAAADRTDGALRLVGTLQDVTPAVRAEEERRALSEQAQRATRMEQIAVLAGGVAHDLNNLLVTVLGHSELALAEEAVAPGLRSSLDQIRSAGERARVLTRKLLLFAGHTQLDLRPTDLSAVVHAAVAERRAAAPDDVRIELDLAADLPPLALDAGQFRQLLGELLGNAIEALGPGDERCVVVRTALLDRPPRGLRLAPEAGALPASGPDVLIEVVDTGRGMTDAVRERAFEPFFSTRFAGRGLGLSAALGIARAHGGTIAIDSAPGQGTRVRTLIPLPGEARADPVPIAAAPAAVDDEDGDVEDAGGDVTVLVVDDDESVCELLRVALPRRGLRVVVARNGREGVEAVRANGAALDVVLLDVVMPVMGGEEAYREIREVRPDLPVLVMSGYSDPAVSERLQREGIAGFFAKPFQLAPLVARIRAVAGKPARRGAGGG